MSIFKITDISVLTVHQRINRNYLKESLPFLHYSYLYKHLCFIFTIQYRSISSTMVSKTRGPPDPESLLTWLVIHCLDSSKCVVSETRIAHQFHVFFFHRKDIKIVHGSHVFYQIKTN